MDRELEKIPGVIWNFSQPISDNVEEAVSGVKGELAVKVYGDDLKTLEAKGDEIVAVMSKDQRRAGSWRLSRIGQPNLNYAVDRQAAARYGINVADVQDAIQTAVGGGPYRRFFAEKHAMTSSCATCRNIVTPKTRLIASSCSLRLANASLAQLTTVQTEDGAEEIYRENGQRYIAIKYSVRGRDLGSTVEEAIDKVNHEVKLPAGYHMDWAGEYASQKRANKRLLLVLPITMLLIFMILYTMFKSFKWAVLILMNVAMAPVGGLLALLLTGTNFSVSSGVGFLALFGVSVQTGVIMLEYINQLRVLGYSIEESAAGGAVLRLRPIMMTSLVATLGLLPAALSHGIGSDSQRPFAIVIVGGLITALFMSIFLLPTLYVWMAGEHDVLPAPEPEFED